MKINFYLADSRCLVETKLVCYIGLKGYRKKVNTDISTLPKHWNSSSMEFRKSHPCYNELNLWLKQISDFIYKTQLEWIQKNANLIKSPIELLQFLQDSTRRFVGRLNSIEVEDASKRHFWQYFNNLLYKMDTGSRTHLKTGNPLAPKTVAQFHNLKRHLQNFEKHTSTRIDFDTINISFYKSLLEYLTITLNSSPNTVGKLITNLKVVLRDAYEDGVTKNDFYRNRNFLSPNSVSDTIYLSLEEVEAIYNLDLKSRPSYDRVRDMFIIGCYTGLRYSDLVQINPDSIESNMINLVQAKTNNRILVPIRPIVARILAKYNSSLPRISNQKFNAYLYEVCKMIDILSKDCEVKTIKGGKRYTETKPKYELVSSHTARRTFATNEFKLGELSVQDIMAITGHKTTKAFYKYIRETPNEVSLRVASIWSKRDKKDDSSSTFLKAV